MVIQGQFDAAKLQAAAGKLVDAGKLKAHARGDVKIFEFKEGGDTFFGAVLDKSHVALAMNKMQIEAALDKAAGKKKTALKHKAIAEMFGKLKAADSTAVIATADAVVGHGGSSKVNPDGTVETKYTLHTLGDNGIQAIQATVNVGDAIKARTVLTLKDAATAGKIEEVIHGGIKQGIAELEKSKEFPALLKAMKTIKVGVKDATLTLEGEGDGDAVQQFFLALLVPRTSSKPGTTPNPTKP